MSSRMIRCPHCGRIIQAAATYCSYCGEALDPALVAELQWLYGALNDLDTRIARGEGDQTITALRDEYRDRYLTARRAPAAAPATASAIPAASSPTRAPSPAAASAAPSSSAPSAPAAPPAPVAPSTPPRPRPDGPVFSWQAFLSEQAIAIMMYMGGFLGLVAMLSFEIGGWQSLDLRVKLGAIIVVYVAFGALGLLMRRLPRLHTVGGAYLGVFALMTPLLALGIYRFGLQAAGFSGAAMLCLSSAYAAIVYLALAWRTRFVTYAYLGWSALILATLAAVFWAEAPGETVIFALAFVSLLLLLPSLFRLFAFADLLEAPALQLAAVTSLAAASGALFLGLALATRAIDETPLAVSAAPPPHYSTAVFALASCSLVLVAGAWSYLARGLTRELDEETRSGRLNVIDWLIVAMATQAVIALAAWFGADRQAMAVVLSALALAESAALFVLWRRARERTELRFLVETLALALAIIACLGVASDPAPNWPYLLALTSGLAVTGGLAFFEAAPFWLLPAGVFLSLGYYTLLDTLFHQPLAQVSVEQNIPVQAVAAAVLVLILVVPWQVAGPDRVARRFAASAYVIALGNALYAAIHLVRQDAFYATLILGLFVLLALVSGWRSRYPLVGGLVAAFFGFFLPLPLTVAGSGGAPRFVVGAAVAAIVMALLALGIRALLGRASALPAYLVALWMALVVSFRLLINHNYPNDWLFLGISLPIWLLLAFALLATIVIFWENAPWAMFIPALFGFVAAYATPGLADAPGLALAVTLAAAGIALRFVRGRWTWSIAWYLAALLAAVLQIVVQGITLDSQGLSWRVLVGPLFIALAYVAAATERQPWMTAVVPFFALGATFFFPTLQDFVPTLVMVYGLALVGLTLRLAVGTRWAVACYVAAIAPSLLAVSRAVPPTAGEHEALLLIFALTAYGIALIERRPGIGWAAVAYAGLAAVFQPDPHPLLALTLTLAGVGIVVGRFGGWRWAWPVYISALAVGMVTALASHRDLAFAGWTLLALALAAYVVAMVESQVESLALALFFGALALLAADRALDLALWQAALTFVALAWLYTLGQWLWGALPWLRNRAAPPWWDLDAQVEPGIVARWLDTRLMGRMIHHGAGLLVGALVAVGALLTREAYLPQTPLAQVEVVALVSLALLLALSAWSLHMHWLWYVAGALVAIAVSWQVRWLGADNIQAFVLAPGSYLLLVGALLPADRHFHNSLRAGQMASLLGALLLMLPTLAQSFTTAQSENWIYASALALEALAIAAVGVGTHTRALILLGTGFFGLAAIRGALLAFSSGVPVALIIAALALLLMGGATWLSLRVRREAGAAQP